jgi:hypothetical protein
LTRNGAAEIFDAAYHGRL